MIRAVALALRIGAGAALGLAVIVAGREIWRNHEGWAVDALGWAAALYAAQVAMLALGWQWLGEGTWPGRARRVWLRAFVHGWVARYLPGPLPRRRRSAPRAVRAARSPGGPIPAAPRPAPGPQPR